MNRLICRLALIVLPAMLIQNAAQAGFIHPITEHISYQGQLQQGGEPFSGTVPMTFRIWNEESGGGQTGGDIVENVDVSEGLFQVDLDFGNAFGGEAKWLEIEVDGQVLAPRQRIRAAPLALHALSVQSVPLTSRWSVATGGIHFPGGHVGIGTSTPAAELQVIGSALFGNDNHTIGDSQNFIGGGIGATATGNQSFTGGGIDAVAQGHQSFVGGGVRNEAIGSSSFVGGGLDNQATGSRAFVGGGRRNKAHGGYSFVGGGRDNDARSSQAFVSGGRYNCAGARLSWAGGYRAKVRPIVDPGQPGACANLSYPGGFGDEGTFVWADHTEEDFVSTGPNQFLVRASGGMGIGTNQPAASLHIAGDGELLLEGSAPRIRLFRPGVDANDDQNTLFVAANGTLVTRVAGTNRMAVTNAGNVGIGTLSPTYQLQLSIDSAFKPGTNTWTTSSDARLKTDIEPLAGALDKLLALRGVSFRWRDPAGQGGNDSKQMGLLAQDVEAVIPEWVGEDAAGYKTLTIGGFEGLVAEALRELGARHQAEIAELTSSFNTRVAELEDQLEAQRQETARRLALLEALLAGEQVARQQ